MNYINLVNVNVLSEKVVFEFLYKSKTIGDDEIIYFENDKNEIYYGSLRKAPNPITYTYFDNEEVEIAKVLVEFDIKYLGSFKVKTKNDKSVKELEILNNQNLVISTKENPYTIFTKKHMIDLKQSEIIIKNRNPFSKFVYELNKQIYSLKKYHKLAKYRFVKKDRKYYLFNDRLMYGDDNAEELFKYVNNNEKLFSNNSYFVLDKDSDAIDRISKLGKVVLYGSDEHKKLFINCKMVISSHSSFLDKCFNPFSNEEMDLYKDIINKKFVFLQHGIIMNDVRIFSNRCLTTADLFTTTTEKEYEYLKGDDYMYEEKQIIKTGLPRYDRLIDRHEKIILVSPTWRNYGEDFSIDNLEKTEYYQKYTSFLKNPELAELLAKYGFKLKFLLHPVFQNKSELFSKYESDNIKIISLDDNRYSDLFCECMLLITDYSSIHYDVASMKKPIIYYQFDKDFFFGKHYGKGYFSYDKDGFGPVIEKEDELIDYLKDLLKNDCKSESKYLKKVEDTFMYLDHNNCKRVMEYIKELDNDKSFDYRFNLNH